jgi:polysaccharide biosynthesis/export protein
MRSVIHITHSKSVEPRKLPGRSRLQRFTTRMLVASVLVLVVMSGRAWGQEYLLGPGDELAVVVLGDSDLTRTVTIRPDGKISLPLAGEITATGLTPAQVGVLLTTALKPYFKDPRVTVTLFKPRGAFIYVVGQVRSPGSYDFQPGWTALEAITKAGGLSDRADVRQAVLIRKASSQSIPLDLDRLIIKGDESANITLEVGDVILVPELRNRVLVLGNVRSPGAYDLKDGARLLDALAAAGGPDSRAALKTVSVARQMPPSTQTSQATQTSQVSQASQAYAPVAIVDVTKILIAHDYSLNLALQNADIIYVPNRPVTFADVMQWLAGVSLGLTLLR